MFIYKNLYDTINKEGVIMFTPFVSNIYMPFVEADQMIIKNLAMNHLLIQRDNNSVTDKDDLDTLKTPIEPNPNNINSLTYSYFNRDTEFNCMFDGSTEGGQISFGGEVIEAMIIRRSSARTKHKKWEDIAILPVDDKSLYTLSKVIYDPFIEHGLTYQYAIQPVSRDGVRGMQINTPKRYAYYEDCWILGADNKQLMVGYNPQVSSMKTVVKESVIETIGSRYPYIIKNAQVGYKQFSFNCTITYHMNIGESFTENKNIWVDDEYKKDIDDSTGGDQGGGETDLPENIVRVYEGIIIDKNIKLRVEPKDDAKFYNKTGQDYLHMRLSVQKKPLGTVDIWNGFALRPGDWMETSDGKWVGMSLPVAFAQDPDPNTEDYEIPVGATHVLAWVRKGEPREVEMIQSLNIMLDEPETPSTYGRIGVNTEVVSYSTKSIVDNEALSLGFENENDVINKWEDYDVFDKRMDSSDIIYMQEREFRRRVMDFLYDGQPKIFKSPTEGMIMVRITDINFSPRNELGRKIYDFSCTMTEIGEINTETLAKYNFREAVGDSPIVQTEATMENGEVGQLYGLFKNV